MLERLIVRMKPLKKLICNYISSKNQLLYKSIVMTNLTTKLFKFTAILEGFSFLLLLFNNLFLKPNNVVLYKSLLFPIGMTHGILFIAYLYLAFMNKKKQNWSTKDLLIIILGSLIPFGAFYVEKKYLKNA